MGMESLHIGFKRIMTQMGATILRTSLAPHKIRVSFPIGLPYEAFDGSAQVKPWHLLHLVECSRSAAFTPFRDDGLGSFIDFRDISHDTYHFNVVTQLDIRKEMYDVSFPKSPLDLFITLHHVGKTSMTLLTEVMHPCHPEPLFTNTTLSVCVDGRTRKSSPLPDFWVEKYKHLAVGEPLMFSQVRRPDDPSQVSSCPRVVLAGDVDPYLHLNWVAYLRYCHESKVGAKLAGGEKVTPRDLSMTIKSATVAYLQEGNLGDRLCVDHWKGQEEGVWHFEVTREGQPMVQAAVELYDLDQKEARVPPSRL